MPLALLFSLLAASPAEPAPGIVWATVTREPALRRERVTLEFGTLGVVRGRPDRLVYFAKRTATRNSDAREVRWADSLACPAMVAVLADLRGLPTPRIDVPGFPGQPGGIDETITLDGISYRLNLSDRLSYAMNVNSTLSRWTEETIRRLEPCWQAEMPRSPS